MFLYKLTREDKIEIYEGRLKGEIIRSIAKSFNVYKFAIKYLISLIKKHGYDILRNGKNRIYSKEFKSQIINRKIIMSL
ncbi:transposase [Fusobacterium animalis]|uniref:Transposase n=1 Tax=Fusobacterium animalis TaxID=76859 RepID=A0A2B7YZL1_9FUSO|nr:transposase [Fusobacterium animalis]